MWAYIAAGEAWSNGTLVTVPTFHPWSWSWWKRVGTNRPSSVTFTPLLYDLTPLIDLGGALRRVGVGVEHPADGLHARPIGLVGRLPLEIAGGLRAERAEGPGVRPGDLRVVAAAEAVRRDHHRLGVDVGRVLVVRRAGDDEAELRRAAGVVILEDQARALALGVDLARS